MKSILAEVSQRLAGIQSLDVEECERAFGCTLRQDATKPRQYWGTCPELSIEVLDVRIGARGGVVVANFERGAQLSLAREARAFGEPEGMDIVSPPMAPAGSPAWSRKWSVAHRVAGARIWFGLEEVGGEELLVSASRNFSKEGSAR